MAKKKFIFMALVGIVLCVLAVVALSGNTPGNTEKYKGARFVLEKIQTGSDER